MKMTRINFRDIYRESLIVSWINKATIYDNRKNNQGKPHKYKIINEDVIKELPKFILTYKGNFQQQIIFQKMVIDLYYENQKKYEHLIKPEDVEFAIKHPKKPKTFSKGWFMNLKQQFNIKFDKIEIIGRKKFVTEMSINGKKFKRNEY